MTTHTQQILERFDEVYLDSLRNRFGRARFEGDGELLREDIKNFLTTELSTLENAVREETLKEVIDLLPEIDDGIHPATGMPEYLEINKGITRGRNECRELILSSIKSLSALSSK